MREARAAGCGPTPPIPTTRRVSNTAPASSSTYPTAHNSTQPTTTDTNNTNGDSPALRLKTGLSPYQEKRMRGATDGRQRLVVTKDVSIVHYRMISICSRVAH